MKDNMNINKEWLESNGYKQDLRDGSYSFVYRNGIYGARIEFYLYDIIAAPLEYIKDTHEKFMKRAENKEIF